MSLYKIKQQNLDDAFSSAVADMRRMFPEECTKIAFIHTQEAGWKEQVTAWLETIEPNFKKLLINSWAEKERRSLRMEMAETDSPKSTAEETEDLRLALDSAGKQGGFAVQDPITRHGLVVVGIRDAQLFSVSPRVEMEMTVFHEAGHLIVPLGYFHGKDNLLSTDYARYYLVRQCEEIAADSFATLCGIKTGSLSREDVIALSFNRSLEYFFSGQTDHLTSLALDRLLLEENEARIISLAPQEIKEVAERYAALNECSANDHSLHHDGLAYPCAKTNFYQPDVMPMPKKLGERFAAFAKWGHEYSKPTQPAYYIADKILRHIVEVGAVFYPQSLKVNTEGAEWDKIRERLANRPPAIKTQRAKWRKEGPLADATPKAFLQRIFSS